MALGKNVKKDKLIPTKAKEEVSEKKAVKRTAVKKAAPAKKKSAPKPKAVKQVVEKVEAPVEKKQEEVVAVPDLPRIERAPVQKVEKRERMGTYRSVEELEEKKRLKAKYDEDILGLRGKSIQLIVFSLGGDKYALEISDVKEIVPSPKVSQIPHAPAYVKGVANIRGAVMVIIDLEEKFELFKMTDQNKTKDYALLLKNDNFRAGILVSEVPTTLKIEGDKIEISSGIMSNTVLDETFIKGLIKQDDDMIILLDIMELIQNDEVGVIAQAVEDRN